MGAWAYGVFDDDTAYDALDDLQASSKFLCEKGFEYRKASTFSLMVKK